MGAARRTRVLLLLLAAGAATRAQEEEGGLGGGRDPCIGMPLFRRTASGVCNSLASPSMGMKGTPLAWLTFPNGTEGSNGTDRLSASTSSCDTPTPNPRVLSNALAHLVSKGDFQRNVDRRTHLTSLAWLWAHFVANDLFQNDLEPSPDPIPAPPCEADDDGNEDPLCGKTIPFRPSKRASPHAFPNPVTHFMDCSQIYGSDDAAAAVLREPGSGRLRVSMHEGRAFPPVVAFDDKSRRHHRRRLLQTARRLLVGVSSRGGSKNKGYGRKRLNLRGNNGADERADKGGTTSSGGGGSSYSSRLNTPSEQDAWRAWQNQQSQRAVGGVAVLQGAPSSVDIYYSSLDKEDLGGASDEYVAAYYEQPPNESPLPPPLPPSLPPSLPPASPPPPAAAAQTPEEQQQLSSRSALYDNGDTTSMMTIMDLAKNNNDNASSSPPSAASVAVRSALGLVAPQGGDVSAWYCNVVAKALHPTCDGACYSDGAGDRDDSHREGEHVEFATGTPSNLHPGLAALHTLFLREHNAIVAALERKYPGESADDYYWAARESVCHTVQTITLGANVDGTSATSPNGWLPTLLTYSGMQAGGYDGYQPEAAPVVWNEFGAALERAFHAAIPDTMPLPGDGGVLNMNATAFHGANVALDKGIAPLLIAHMRQEMPAIRPSFADAFRNQLFASVKRGQAASAIAGDLFALDVQRGRDHAVPSLRVVTERLSELGYDAGDPRRAASPGTLDVLMHVYGCTADENTTHPCIGDAADLLAAALSQERYSPQHVLPPAVASTLHAQFNTIRAGDRFFSTADAKHIERLASVLLVGTDDPTSIINLFARVRAMQYGSSEAGPGEVAETASFDTPRALLNAPQVEARLLGAPLVLPNGQDGALVGALAASCVAARSVSSPPRDGSMGNAMGDQEEEDAWEPHARLLGGVSPSRTSVSVNKACPLLPASQNASTSRRAAVLHVSTFCAHLCDLTESCAAWTVRVRERPAAVQDARSAGASRLRCWLVEMANVRSGFAPAGLDPPTRWWELDEPVSMGIYYSAAKEGILRHRVAFGRLPVVALSTEQDGEAPEPLYAIRNRMPLRRKTSLAHLLRRHLPPENGCLPKNVFVEPGRWYAHGRMNTCEDATGAPCECQ